MKKTFSTLLTLLLINFFVIFLLTKCDKKNSNNPIVVDTNLIVFNIASDSVQINPYGSNPLGALVNFISPIQGNTLIEVVGKNGILSNITHQFNDWGLLHSIPVVGLYPNFNNKVNIYITDKNGKKLAISTINIQTGNLPPNLPVSIKVTTIMEDKIENGINLVSNFSATNPYIPLAIDNYGDIRWLLDYSNNSMLSTLSYDCGIARLNNGNFFFGDTYSNKIFEVDLLGKVVNSWDLHGYLFHHNVTEKPDGNFLVTVTDPNGFRQDGTESEEDVILEINRQNSSIDNIWDLKQCLDENRNCLTTNAYDWVHVNGVLYDASDNTIVVSGRTQCVVKLDYNNNVKWIMAPHHNWTKNRRGEDLNKYLLTPLDSKGNPITDSNVISGFINSPDFEWNWFQHSPILMPNGDLMVFDNGDVRNYGTEQTTKYSRAVQFKINPKNMTVQQVWEYGKERGMETFSRIVSKVEYLPKSNHVMFCPGYQVLNNDGQGGKIIEVDYNTKQVVFEMSISSQNLWGFHRTYRTTMYP